jgi:hypothetical protein
MHQYLFPKAFQCRSHPAPIVLWWQQQTSLLPPVQELGAFFGFQGLVREQGDLGDSGTTKTHKKSIREL